MTGVVQRNIRALIERRRQAERSRLWRDRLADAVARFTGSVYSVYLHAALVAAWLSINFGWTPLPRFDPTFVMLAMVASVEAIFLTTFVLISQNRMRVDAEERADLDLHISLLAEHEITRLVQILDAVAQHLGVDTGRDPALDELKQDIAPEAVLNEMEAHEEAAELQDYPTR